MTPEPAPEPAPDPTRAGPPQPLAPVPEGSATFWNQLDGEAPAARPAVALPAAVTPGVVVGGDFEVVARLGAGGMGVVYRARQRSLGREVALKLLPADAVARPTRERFLREARAAATISHPNVITVFAAGHDEPTGRLFMAMELVPGGDARALALRSGGRLPERRALEVARDAARGLTAIEAAGMFHRDVKPANLLLAADGTAKLADLGLARGLADRMTETGTVLGTPAFMSPEQALGRQSELDIGTDIYALGATLYDLLTGEPPFAAPALPTLFHMILTAPPPDPRALVPSVSPATAAIVRRAMAKARAERHATAADLVADLERALAALDDERAPTRARSTVAAAAAAVAALALVAGVGAVVVRRASERQRPTPGAPPAPVAVEPAVTPEVTPEPAPVTTSITVSWRRDGARAHPDFALTDATTAEEFNHKLTLVQAGVDVIEARFVLHGQPTWARLTFDHEGARIGGEGRCLVDVEVNGRALVARGAPEDAPHRRLDLTGVARPGENTLRIRLHPESLSGYWLRELTLEYGTGAPPE